MLQNAQIATCLFAILAGPWVITACSPDDTTPGGGSGGSTTSTSTSTTHGGAGGSGGGGAGGGGAGGGGAGGADASATGGGAGAAGSMAVDAASDGGPVDVPSDLGPPQAGTAVILIDNVFVVEKSLGDASSATDAAEAGGDGGATDGDISDALVVSEGAGATGVSYTFDSDIDGWHYTPYGSTPNIGFLDPGTSGRLKLSDPSVSQLEFDSTNDADGRVDASGALKLTVGFYAANDQIDVQAFTANPNDATQWKVWRGFRATARVKFVSGGNLNPACPLRMTIYISTGISYATVLSPPVNLTAGSDWATLTFDFDTIAPGETGLDVTQVNQLGIQANTGVCSPNPG